MSSPHHEAELLRLVEETKKFVAEAHKLEAEQARLRARVVSVAAAINARRVERHNWRARRAPVALNQMEPICAAGARRAHAALRDL